MAAVAPVKYKTSSGEPYCMVHFTSSSTPHTQTSKSFLASRVVLKTPQAGRVHAQKHALALPGRTPAGREWLRNSMGYGQPNHAARLPHLTCASYRQFGVSALLS